MDRPPVHACCTGDARPTRGASSPSHSASSSPAGTAPPHATVTRAPRPAKRAGARLTLEGLRSAHRSPRWRPLAAHPAAPQPAQRTKSRAAAELSARAGARRRADGQGRRAKALRRTTRTASAASPRCLQARGATRHVCRTCGGIDRIHALARGGAARLRCRERRKGPKRVSRSFAFCFSCASRRHPRAAAGAAPAQQPPPPCKTHAQRPAPQQRRHLESGRATHLFLSFSHARSLGALAPAARRQRRCGSLGVCLPAHREVAVARASRLVPLNFGK